MEHENDNERHVHIGPVDPEIFDQQVHHVEPSKVGIFVSWHHAVFEVDRFGRFPSMF